MLPIDDGFGGDGECGSDGRGESQDVYCVAPVCVAFLDRAEISAERKKKLGLWISNLSKTNPPTFRIHERRLREITPANPMKDAYIAALLIALAQSRRAEETAKGAGDEKTGAHTAATEVPSESCLRKFTVLLTKFKNPRVGGGDSDRSKR